jgi:hypothetical protein
MQGFRNSMGHALKLMPNIFGIKWYLTIPFYISETCQSAAVLCAARKLIKLVLMKQELYKHLTAEMRRFMACYGTASHSVAVYTTVFIRSHIF